MLAARMVGPIFRIGAEQPKTIGTHTRRRGSFCRRATRIRNDRVRWRNFVTGPLQIGKYAFRNEQGVFAGQLLFGVKIKCLGRTSHERHNRVAVGWHDVTKS